MARQDPSGSSLHRTFAWMISRFAGLSSTVASRSRAFGHSIASDQIVAIRLAHHPV
jgi:hypothetical protein